MSFYAVLNLPDYASIEDIKKAFKKLALRTHPDKSKQAMATEFILV